MTGVSIVDGPYFNLSLDDQEVMSHSDAIFLCAVEGNPVPTITWTRDGQVLSSSVNRISIQSDNSKLVVQDARPSDAAYYTCTAQNTVTNMAVTHVMRASSTAKLDVVGKPFSA